MAADCKSGKGVAALIPLMRKVLADKIEGWQEKGMTGRAIRGMVAGIPNVGKSSLINRLAKNSKAKVEDRPGVTRANQWFVPERGVEMLDTPGVLWPKFEDQQAARFLAFTGAIRDRILDGEELAGALLSYLCIKNAGNISARYGLSQQEISQCGRTAKIDESAKDDDESAGQNGNIHEERHETDENRHDGGDENQHDAGIDGAVLLELIGRRRGMLERGGKVDGERAAAMVLDEFRAGRMGRITLEYPT